VIPWIFFLKNWPKMVKFSQLILLKHSLKTLKILMKMVNFPFFTRKNRPIFKTAFCQNNEKFRGGKKEKESLLPIYQDLLELSKIRRKSHQNYRSFDEREEERKKKRA
jgi:hypothetical protein